MKTAIGNRPFSLSLYLIALLFTGLVIFIVALLIDGLFSRFGVHIHPWREALISSVAGVVCSGVFVPVLWKLGLKTLTQYFLGGLALFLPCTLISLIFVHYYSDVVLEVDSIHQTLSSSQALVVTFYIRIGRSVLLFPLYIFSFWLIYHKLFNSRALSW